MRTRILLLIVIALLGLAAVVAVAGFNLRQMGLQIQKEQETTAVLNDIGNDAMKRTLELRLRVAALFAVKSKGDLETENGLLDKDLANLNLLLEKLHNPDFDAALTITLEDGRTLKTVVDNLESGMAKLSEAGSVAYNLANDRLALKLKLGPAKDALSKAFRACLELQNVDGKGFSVLARGVITTISTDSGRDVKFAGNAKFTEGVAVLSKAKLSDAQKTALDALVAAYAPAYELIREHLAAADDGVAFTRAAESQLHDITLLQAELKEAFIFGQDQLVKRSHETLITTLWLAGGIAAISLIAGMLMARSMTRRLKEGGLAIERVRAAMEQGDLTARVGLTGQDEMASISTTVDGTLARLQKLMAEIAHLAQGVNLGTAQLQQTSANLSQIANMNSKRATELGGTVGDVRQGVESAAENANQFARSVHAVADSSRQAADLAREAVTAVVSSNQSMQRLTASTKEIGEILDTITQITSQTQLLSLNAAIEAASAGPAGRGFTVVASEVKALAVKTANAAVQINKRIDAIQHESNEAGEAIIQVGSLISRISSGQESIAQATSTQVDSSKAVAQNLDLAVNGTNSAAGLANHMITVATETNQASQQVAQTAESLATGARNLEAFFASHRYE